MARDISAKRNWRERLRDLVVNLGVSLATICLFLLICEFGVFRLVLLASDVPANDFADGLVRYAPDQSGVWREGDEIAAPYRINDQGWNSGSGNYRRERQPGTRRVALVGDSFVEALQVPYDRSMGEDLARLLGGDGSPVEVYRFAISGAPLSQYLYMVERAVTAYRPDWVVVQIAHNDFDESYRFKPGRYTSSFLKIRVEDHKVVGEVAPRPWTPGFSEWLRRTATARYLVYRQHVRPQVLVDLLLPRAHAAEAEFAANTDIALALADPSANEAVTDYVLGRLKTATQAMGARLLLSMDGDRAAIYRGVDSPILALNRLVAEVAKRREIPFVDLEPVFAADWASEHRRFEFDIDNHWNEHGHAVAGAAVAAGLRDAGWH